MRTKLITLLLVLPYILQGCTLTNGSVSDTKNQGVPTTIDITTSTALPMITPSLAVIPTNSPIPAITNTPPMTSEPKQTMQPSCFTMFDELPKDRPYSGKIVFFGKYVIENNNINNLSYYQTSYYDLGTRQAVEIGPKKVKDIIVSPDRTKYATVETAENQVIIYSRDDQLLVKLPKGEFPYGLDRWLDNENIALVILEPMLGTNYYQYPFKEVVYNIITSEQKQLSSDYPDIDKTQSRPFWEGISSTKYDPSLTRVVYPALIMKDYLGKSGLGYILWNLESHEKLSQIVTGDFAATPKWSPDGSRFVINDNYGDGEFYIITRDGRITKVSHLNTDPIAETAGTRYFSDAYSWSPDGQYIAFWLETIKGSTINATLAVLDTFTSDVTDTCISAGLIEPELRNRMGSFVPVWSQDGTTLVVEANRQNRANFETVLVDLRHKFSAKLGENVFPVGWLAHSGN